MLFRLKWHTSIFTVISASWHFFFLLLQEAVLMACWHMNGVCTEQDAHTMAMAITLNIVLWFGRA